VLRIAERIHSAVAAPLIREQGEVRARVSIGSAFSAAQPGRPDDSLRDAKTALRRAQAMAGNRSELFDSSMHNRAVTRLKLESDLLAALNRDQFRVFYQPVFRIHPREIVRFEALIRWPHPVQGLIAPDEFLEAAEDTGLMAMIGQWVIGEACRHLPSWKSIYGSSSPLQVAVNLSPRHFASPELLDGIKTCLDEAQVRPGTLQLGITARIAMANPDQTASVLSQLKRLEVITAIDDFGAGAISLPAVHHFAANILKIDRTLVASMQADRASQDVVDLIVTLARKLNCEVVAQGIEEARPTRASPHSGLQCRARLFPLIAPGPGDRSATSSLGSSFPRHLHDRHRLASGRRGGCPVQPPLGRE
jgi:EAL domain-containing protein (putative c-di-GMP-specific phosphodiesterase class I)